LCALQTGATPSGYGIVLQSQELKQGDEVFQMQELIQDGNIFRESCVVLQEQELIKNDAVFQDHEFREQKLIQDGCFRRKS